MISKDVQEAINLQIRNEYYSSYLYLSMSAYCESLNFRGFSAWLRKQSEEELTHAMRLYDYLIDRDGRVLLDLIDKPPSEFGSLLEMFQQVLDHEKEVTSMINKLYEIALAENDHATAVELQWFIQEQVEEEKKFETILQKFDLIGRDKLAVNEIDKILNGMSVVPDTPAI